VVSYNQSMRKSPAFILLFSAIALSSCSDDDQALRLAAPRVDALPLDQVTGIFNAVDQKDVAKVRELLGTNPKLIAAISDNGWPLLTVAAKKGDRAMVELLLNSGAEVNAKNYSSEVAIMYASLYGHKEIVELLLAKNADVNVKNDAGTTPLSAATSSHHDDIADLLRQHGAKE
jgi:ankyrin repeat protein